jgi:hypothetical protein
MVIAHSTDTALESKLRALLPSPYLFSRRWKEIARRAREASCVVVHVNPRDTEEVQRFCDVRVSYPHTPVVVIAPETAQLAVALRDVAVDEIVWQTDLSRDFRFALQHALTHGRTNRLLTSIREAGLDDLALDFVKFVFGTRKPIRTVAAAAARLGIDRSTLIKRWRHADLTRLSLTPKDVLEWALLIRSVPLRAAGLSSKQLAKEMQVNIRTLDRISQRQTGASLNHFARHPAGFDKVLVDSFLLPLAGATVAKTYEKSSFCHYV